MKFISGAIALFLFISLFFNQLDAKPVSVMAYNVENFFDNKHDVGTQDYTYLPLSFKKQSKEVQKYCAGMSNEFYKTECLTIDWNDEILNKKIQSAAKVIKSYSGKGVGPDVVILVEIENLNAVNLLAEKGLRGLYPHRDLAEGDDTRGISIGVISKYPIVSTRHYSTFFKGKKLNTRGILEVTIKAEDKLITIYGNHWPSQANPSEERVVSAEQLTELARNSKSDVILAVGDFNTIDNEKPHPYHVMKNDFYDVEQEARELGVELMPGTHNHKGQWSSLDKIFVHKNSRILPDWKTFRIISEPWMLSKGNQGVYPKRFDAKTGEGFSDHLPVVTEIDL